MAAVGAASTAVFNTAEAAAAVRSDRPEARADAANSLLLDLLARAPVRIGAVVYTPEKGKVSSGGQHFLEPHGRRIEVLLNSCWDFF